MSILVFTGPTRSAKSDHLIRRCHALEEQGLAVSAWKPPQDNRDPEDASESLLRSRTGATYPCQYIENLADLKVYAGEGKALVIDEFQFIGAGLPDLVRHFYETPRSTLVMSGLDTTRWNTPWPECAEALEFAHEIRVLRARCDFCLMPGTKTLYLGTSTELVCVGEDEEKKYHPACATCFEAHQN